MKPSVSLGLALGAIGSLAPLGLSPALALPPDTIAQKLNGVPIFLILDKEGQSIVMEQEGATKPVFPVFLTQATAEAELATIRQQAGAQERNFTVTAFPLGEFYKAKMVPVRGEGQFLFVPADQGHRPTTTTFSGIDPNSPNSLFFYPKSEGVTELIGTPLYFITLTNDDGQEFPFIGGENRDQLPLFFDREDLLGTINGIKEQRSELSERLGAQIMLLQQAIELMESGDDDELGNTFQFVPDPAGRKFAQDAAEAIRNQQGGGQ